MERVVDPAAFCMNAYTLVGQRNALLATSVLANASAAESIG